MFTSIQDKLGINAFRFVSCPHATMKLHFSQMKANAIRKLIKFLEVCKCGILCAVYYSTVMEFWPLPLKQRIDLF